MTGFRMNRLSLRLVVLGLVAAMAACDKKERVPLPRTGAGEVKQQAKEAIRDFQMRQLAGVPVLVE